MIGVKVYITLDEVQLPRSAYPNCKTLEEILDVEEKNAEIPDTLLDLLNSLPYSVSVQVREIDED